MKVKQPNTVLLEWQGPIKKKIKEWINASPEAMEYLASLNLYDGQWITKFENMTNKKLIDATLYPYLSDVSKLTGKKNTVYTPLEAVKDVLDIEAAYLKKKEEEEASHGDYEVLLKNSEWYVRKIEDYAAAKYFGRGTRWCITGSKSWENGTNKGEDYWDMHQRWGSILYFVESRTKQISYEVVDSDSKDSTDVRKLTAALKYAVEIRPQGNYNTKDKKYEKAQFIFYDVLDRASFTPPKVPNFPDVYQLAVDAGDVLELKSVVSRTNKAGYPIIYVEDLKDAGISIVECAFLDLDRAMKVPKEILARNYNYLLDYAEFDPLGLGDYQQQQAEQDELDAKTEIEKSTGLDQTPVQEDWAGADDMVSGDVVCVQKDGTVNPTIRKRLDNNKQNYRTAVYTTGGLLTKLKKPGTDELFKQYDLVEFAGEDWYILDDVVLYQKEIVRFPHAALGAARSLSTHASDATVAAAREQLRTTSIWNDMVRRFNVNVAHFGHRPATDTDDGIVYVMSEELLEGYLNLNKPRFYDKKTNTLLCVNMKNKTYRTTPADEEKLEKTTYDAVDLSTIKTIVYILQDAGYSSRKQDKPEDMDETLKENIDMKVKKFNEAFADIDKVGAKEYKGETVYRITTFVEQDGRPLMYVIGLGERDTEKVNYFNPVIRSARYTTEESFLFLSEERAYEFLRAFRKESDQGDDFDFKDLRVTEYHPFREITKLIPIDSPLGRAFVGEQKKIKKKYDDKEDKKD